MIVWTDVETTGLSPEKDLLLEVALVVTDDDLSELASTSVVVRPEGFLIDEVPMDSKVCEMHTRNELLDEIRALALADASRQPGDFTAPSTLRHAEAILLAFLVDTFSAAPPVASDKCAHCGRGEGEHDKGTRCRVEGYLGGMFVAKLVPAISQTPLAGSTIAFDRSFLRRHMPKLEAKFSYRSIDVSSLTELAKRWAPEVYEARPKAKEGGAHRALADVRESINYLRFFKSVNFISGSIRAFDTCRYCKKVVLDGCTSCAVCVDERGP